MQLADMFNGDAARKETLSVCEQALDILRQQKKALHSDALDEARFIHGTWALSVARAEAMSGWRLPGDSIGVGVVKQKEQQIRDLRLRMAGTLEGFETQLETLAEKAFGAKAHEFLGKGGAKRRAVEKMAQPKKIDRQIAEINALIDGGKVTNTARRVVWQAVHKFRPAA